MCIRGCMCVCVYVYARLLVHVYTLVHVCVYLHEHRCVYILIFVGIKMCVCMTYYRPGPRAIPVPAHPTGQHQSTVQTDPSCTSHSH